MAIHPDKETFIKLSKQGNLVPVWTELMADFSTPVSVFSKLRSLGGAFLFESVTGSEHIGRYSFAGAQPRLTLTAYEKKTHISKRGGSRTEEIDTPADPLELVQAQLAPYRPVEIPGLPPFTGGMVGFIGHEYIHRVETTVPSAARDELGAPILHFMLMDTIVAFDNVRQSLRLIVNAHITDGVAAGTAYDNAVAELRALLEVIRQPANITPAPVPVLPADTTLPTGNFTREKFEAMVLASKEYIKSGDIFQIVLSQRFERPYAGDPLDLYRVLRLVNPSPYMFILETGLGFDVVGASPEVNVRLTGDRVEIRPIAGTRTRGANEAEDLAQEKDLLADQKERAEHLMLVDLARNDIGRVCAPGTVKVPEYAIIERYSHVMHIVSQVEGRLAPDKDAFDLFRATFPAGTLSGAPKVRALQIISESEGTRRGVYGGALGYFGFNGNHDSAIAIRTAFLKDGKAYVQAGAGIVADSDPASEYMETVNKARAALKAVAIAAELGRNQV